MTTDGKVRKWTLWLLAIAIASQFYLVQELLAAFAFFAIGFGALTFVILSLFLLEKSLEIAVARIFDGERWMVLPAPAAMFWMPGQDVARSKSAQKLKTENRNSKDSRRAQVVNWDAGQNCMERI